MGGNIKEYRGLRYWLGLIIVVLALVTISVVILSEKKKAMIESEREDASGDLTFISNHIHTHLQRNDYEALEPYLQDWAQYHHGRIAELTLTAANGFVITHIVQDPYPSRIFEVSYTIPYSYENHAKLDLIIDLKHVDEVINNDIKTLGLIIFLSVAVMSFILWLAIKRHSTAVALQKQSEELNRLTIAIEQSPIAIMMTNTEGTVEYVNPRYREQTGYGWDEVVGSIPRIFGDGLNPGGRSSELWGTILGGRIWRGELLNVRKDGKQYWEQTTIGPVKNEDGDITHFIAFNIDITEQKSLREQLLQAQKLEGIGQLAGGVAHDFNNFLSVIGGHAELALNEADMPESARSDLIQISKAAQNAAVLTRQLLMVSKRQVIEPQVIDLNTLIRNMNRMITRLIGEDIEITLDLDDGIKPIKADPGQMEQIFLNLVINAKDAMKLKNVPAGGNRITIATSALYLDADYVARHVGSNVGHHVLIAVSDNGIGMDARTKEKVFEPFFTTKEHGRGTGLGLAMVYGIVKQNNGTVTVESEPGEGTTFEILWPCEAGADISETPGSERTEIRGGNETILVVEDDRDVCEMACRALRRHGYNILKALGGNEALEIARREKQIDMLLTDVVMPGIGGIDLADELKKFLPGLKIIFCSGYTDNLSLSKKIAEEKAHFIQKPYTPEAFARKVRAVLDED